MTPYYSKDGIVLYCGDCVAVMQTMPDNSIDAIVTDPPYGLGFMGKGWDATVPGVEVWIECLRILKPGGHLLAFAGTRTQHRMACAIEDAGFEIRDMIAWVYGSGFPKSLAIDKAIDRMDATDARRVRQLKFTEWMRSSCNIGADEANRLMGTKSEAGHYFTSGTQPHIATREYFEKLRPHFSCDVPEWVEQMVNERTVESENFKRREVVGKATGSNHANGSKSCFSVGAEMQKVEIDITAPATEAARQWSGWGTALKPSLEPITVARKPLIGTVAANVLQYGTGGINVDACRVALNGDYKCKANGRPSQTGLGDNYDSASANQPDTQGRWPANLIHDGSDEVMALFPETVAATSRTKRDFKGWVNSGELQRDDLIYNDGGGSAARFFYTAKADSSERRQSKHPTVKPLDLMRYLVRLVCPAGGIVLDPFMGSGSTIEAARAEHCKSIGIELDAAYCADAVARLRQGVLNFGEGD